MTVVHFGINVELFERKAKPDKQGEWQPAPFGRIERQLDLASRYSDLIMSYSFHSHFYNDGKGPNQAYQDYEKYKNEMAVMAYALRVNAGSGGGSYVAEKNISISANAALPDQHFTQWTSDNGGSFVDASQTFTTFTMPANAVSVTANYGLNEYAVVFVEGAHGTRSGGAALSQAVAHGGDASAPEITSDLGWNFIGWNKSLTNVTGDLIILANYTQQENFAAGGILENAEDGDTAGWDIYDQWPAGALIRNVLDPDSDSNRVISLDGFGQANGFRYTFDQSEKSNFTIAWAMKYAETYTVYISCQTTKGHRYVYYTESNVDGGDRGGYVHHGLGQQTRAGDWIDISRNLQQDLWDFQPDCNIIEVNAFLIRGSGLVDNIGTVEEDHLNTDYWTVYSDVPAGATIRRMIDPDNRANAVIKVDGLAQNNGYKYTLPVAESEKFTVQWHMRYTEGYTIYLSCDTNKGHRYIYYTDISGDFGGGAEYVHHGLGEGLQTGSWVAVSRNLQEDLWDFQPDCNIIKVRAFLVRGSGYFDNIEFGR